MQLEDWTEAWSMAWRLAQRNQAKRVLLVGGNWYCLGHSEGNHWKECLVST